MLQDVEAHPIRLTGQYYSGTCCQSSGFMKFGYNRGWETTMYLSHYLSKGLQTITSKTLMPDYKHTAELAFSIRLDLSNFMII